MRPSIDFVGGSLLEVQFSQEQKGVDNQSIGRMIADQGLETSSIQSSGENQFLIRMKPIEKDDRDKIINALGEKFGEVPQEVRFETVGPTLGKELLVKTLLAIGLAAGAIMTYVAWQFKEKKFGVCAILAMFHDSLVLLGVFSLLGHYRLVEVDTLFVTALLTVLSFSVHDTVVVYDRIRESLRQIPDASLEQIVNKAVSETLVRSLNNSLTIIFMLVALWLLGGETIKWFVVALLVGTVSGTYSSTFTAAPLLVVWDKSVAGKKG